MSQRRAWELGDEPATAGVGAAISLADVVDELGGRFTVLGTPAEELGRGGKIVLFERGDLDGAQFKVTGPAQQRSPLTP